MKSIIKKNIFLSVLCLCFGGDSYGAVVAERGEGRVSSRSPVTAYLEDDSVDSRRADYSGADTSESEWEERREPGQLKETMFGKIVKRKFRNGVGGRGRIPSPTTDSEPEDLETEKSRTVNSINIDEATVEAFNDHVDKVAASINKRKWGNSVRGQQAKYRAFLQELTEDDSSQSDLKALKTLTKEEQLILEGLKSSSETDSEVEEAFRPIRNATLSSKEAFEEDATKILGEFGRLSQAKGRDSALASSGESEEEIGTSQRRVPPLDKATLDALKEHIRRVTKEVGDLNWLPSSKEQRNKLDTLVARLRMTSKRHLLTRH